MAKIRALLYSTTRHAWEVWENSRPIAEGSRERCLEKYPDAVTSEHQQEIAARDEVS